MHRWDLARMDPIVNTFTDVEKRIIILATDDWQEYGPHRMVKKEWLNEPETLGRPAHLCPNWYRSEPINSALFIIFNEWSESRQH